MRLDKIKFAKVASWISRITNGLEFAEDDLRELDAIIDVDIPEAPMLNPETLHVLTALMIVLALHRCGYKIIKLDKDNCIDYAKKVE